MTFVLACDFGSTNARIALIDRQGRTHRSATAPSGAGPAADQDAPEQWWHVFNTLVADVSETIEGIAICGVTRTQVFLDSEGTVLHPAITWRDARAGAAAAALSALAPESWPETGHLNAFHPLARVAWLRDHAPAAYARLHAVIDPKDYLNFRLTGVIASDVVSGARLLTAARPWPDGGDLFAQAGLPRGLTAIPFLHPAEPVGTVREGRLQGVPVFCSAHDTWATVAGMGALRPGLAYNISGTTEVFGAIGADPVTASGLLSVDWGPGIQQIGGPSQSGADTVAWLLPLLSGDGAVDHLLQGHCQPQPALFLPFLSGERTPYWEPLLRAAWLGLNRQHGPTDLAHAVLEGVAFLNLTVLQRAEAALGRQVAEIRFGGGGAANTVWCQVKADITGRPVVVAEASEPGLLGCAAVAWTGLGAYSDITAAQRAMVRMARRYEPDPARHETYGRLFAIWTDAVAATRDVSARLASFT